MTTAIEPDQREAEHLAAQADNPSGGTVGLAVEEVVPAHLLDGDEEVHFAIKPSAWFVLVESFRWVVAAGIIAGLAWVDVSWSYRAYFLNIAILIAGGRLGWATLEWVSRLYVLTNHRVMSIRGIFTVEMFECRLDRIQNTLVTMSVSERMARVGTITFQTAAATAGGTGSCGTVSRPLEVHEKLRDAIHRAQNRGINGV